MFDLNTVNYYNNYIYIIEYYIIRGWHCLYFKQIRTEFLLIDVVAMGKTTRKSSVVIIAGGKPVKTSTMGL